MSRFKNPSVAVDVLTATAFHLRGLLESGTVTSVELVDIYLAQIEKHNRQGANLRAMISTVDHNKLTQVAQRLDEERSTGRVRGPLHGIPFVVKVWRALRD
jgi:amidase